MHAPVSSMLTGAGWRWVCLIPKRYPWRRPSALLRPVESMQLEDWAGFTCMQLNACSESSLVCTAVQQQALTFGRCCPPDEYAAQGSESADAGIGNAPLDASSEPLWGD